MIRWAGLGGAAGLLFAVLATANSGGYRYGASDQAFYGPAVAKRLDPSLFPRDQVLFAPQMRAWLADDLFASLARTTGADLPTLFGVTYAVTLAALCAAAVWFARGLRLSWWAVAAFLLMLTLRHQITKTGANSLEGYMHPRVLAFALGVAALGCVLRMRYAAAAMWASLAAAFHPTTALWFGAVVAVAYTASRTNKRATLVAAGVVATIGLSVVLAGPLGRQLVRMDPAWLSVLAEKDYLFPAQWPAYAWAVNLTYPVVLMLMYRNRRTRGAVVPGERPLVAGLLALVVIFLISVPLTAAFVALAVQLQISRVFWLLDFSAAAYVAWWLMSRRFTQRLGNRAAVLLLLGAISAGRGYYVLRVETDRPLAQVSLPATPWTEVMTWLSRQPSDWHVLADPGHASKYGVSVRLAAAKDTYLEAAKDPAMAMYDRDVAMRVADRQAAATALDGMTATGIRALRGRFGLDVFIVEADKTFDFPVLYRNAQFVVYDLR